MNLTRRREKICELLAQGFSLKQIADKLGITVDGVQSHLRAMRKGTHSENSTRLVLWFMFLRDRSSTNRRLKRLRRRDVQKRVSTRS